MQEFLKNAVWVFVFGGLGSTVRYGAGVLIGPQESPWAYPTLLINLVGAFLAGVVWSLALQKGWLSEPLLLATLVGFLGGLTTFSTMELEATQLLSLGQGWTAGAYLLVSIALGLLACGAGVWIGRVAAGA